jgi:hypothetical protein
VRVCDTVASDGFADGTVKMRICVVISELGVASAPNDNLDGELAMVDRRLARTQR